MPPLLVIMFDFARTCHLFTSTQNANEISQCHRNIMTVFEFICSTRRGRREQLSNLSHSPSSCPSSQIHRHQRSSSFQTGPETASSDSHSRASRKNLVVARNANMSQTLRDDSRIIPEQGNCEKRINIFIIASDCLATTTDNNDGGIKSRN